MRISTSTIILLIILTGLSVNLSAQDIQGRRNIIDATNVKKLNQLEQKFREQALDNKKKALSLAKEKGWTVRKEFKDGRVMELQGLTKNNKPLYYITYNSNAAATVSTNEVWDGGSAGLDLDGTGMKAGVWDGGAVLTTHQEFNNTGTPRVVQQDNPSSTSDHATHVTGTVGAGGVDGGAKGMAYNTIIDAYDWDSDLSEMASAAGNGLLISNHSYGYLTGWEWDGSQWVWYGDESISDVEDYNFGFYDNYCVDHDNLALSAPYYLIVKAAGNDRGDGPGSSPSTAEKDGGSDGYDCIGHVGISKNILTVGAARDLA